MHHRRNNISQIATCIILCCLIPSSLLLSYPTALQPDTSYQTGTYIVINSNFTSTAEQVFSIPYTSVMATASLNATLGLYGVNYYMINNAFGWKLFVASVTSSNINIHLAVFSSTSPIYYLKVCYLISSKASLDINYVEYNFTTEIVADYPSGGIGYCFLNCRTYTTSQSYSPKPSSVVRTFLSGFRVGSLGGLSQDYFGITLTPYGATTSSFWIDVTVYGAANLVYVSYYYLSYDSVALNVLYYSTAMSGHGTLGCYYPTNNCGTGGAISTTTFNTGATSVLSYTVSMFYMGIDSMIVKFSNSVTYTGEFDVTSMTQNSDTTVKVNFAFSGNNLAAFSVGYSYFTFQTFYCPPGGPDYYFVYGTNKCDSVCNNSISQFMNASNVCQLCASQCYKCVGTETFCTACYNSQNRVLNGNNCACDVSGGYYDDGTSLVCPQCHYSCLTCSGPTSGGCVTCDSTSNRYKLNNTCPCVIGYYDANAKICVACHYTCQTATCTGTGSTNCATCNPSKFRANLTTNNTCVCTNGYYDNGTSSELCSACHYSCQTCTTTNVYCTSCDATQLRSLNNATHTCPCNSAYFDNGVSLCVACDSTCLTCSGALTVNCLTCDPSAHRTKVVTSCLCANYYYDLNKVCTACHYSCLTCTNNTSVGCSTCDGSSHRTFKPTTGECLCNAAYVDMGVLTCQACSASCLTCIYNTTACSACHSNPGRYQAGYSCLCQSAYVDLTFNGVCTSCHYSCATCFNGNSTGCSTCSNNRTLTNNSCLCPTGQYDNGYSVVCQPCNVLCQSCSSGISSGCTGCNSLYYRVLNPSPLGSCVCQGGYYEVGTLLCATCDPKCLTCVTLATTCTSCDSTTNHRAVTANFTCDCTIGYFQTGAPVCSACVSTCYTCSNYSSFCTGCFSDRYLFNNTCYCNAGTFQNMGGTCSACSPACLTCVNTSTTCLTCPANANRYQSGTSCPCSTGFYDSGVAVCATCNYTCYNCTSLLVCGACPSNSYRTLTMGGLCPCNSGYYDNGNSACLQCSPYCATCITYAQCTTCNSSQYRTWNNLTMTCPCQTAYYDNGLNTTCSACHYSCATCYAGLSNNCYTCPLLRTFTMPYSCPCMNGYYQSGGVCVACSLICQTCSVTSTNCTSCPATSYLSSYQCICLGGYFMNGVVCQACDVRCLTCVTTAANCQSCNPLHGSYLNGSSCICNSNQYQNNVTLVCTSCNSYCLTCTSNTNTSCLSCYSYMYRTISGSNTCVCMPGYYDAGILNCSLCLSPCLTCNGGTTLNCTSCISGYTLVGSSCMPIVVCANYYYNGVCINSCPNTTYPGVNVCTNCINNCLTCTSISVCTSCLINFYLSNGVCYAHCPISTYINITSNADRICNACPVACYECSMRNASSLVCQSCNSGYYLLDYQCINVTNCSTTNQTYVLINNMCKPCHQQCATCFNLQINGCLTCNINYYYYSGMCLTDCPQGYYGLNRVCTACIANCTSCSTSGCNSCSAGNYLTTNLECVKIGYFLSQGSMVKCHPNCRTCTNSSFSSCILCSQYRGDASSKAVSGYCDCWKDSIDLGNGICDKESFKPIQKANEALVSATTSLNYLSALTGVICVNFFAPLMITSYQQQYSNFYYLNSSSVLQTDEVLNNYGDTNFNKLMEKQTNKDAKKYSRAFGRRLTQQEESLFMRGYSWRYLIDWGLYTFICIAVAWAIGLILSLGFQKIRSWTDKEGVAYKLAHGVFIVFKENIQIVLHLLTISQVSLYGFASFKLLPSVVTSIDPILLTFSVIMFAYYVLYLLRLFVVGAKFVGRQQQENQFMVMFSCFYSHKKKQALCRIYLPMMMLRSLLISLVLVFLAFNPIGQIVSAFLIFILFTIYSFVYCPYYFYLCVFVHIFEGIFIVQLLLLLISVAQPDTSRVGPAYGLIFLNYLQLASFLVLTILIVLNKIYDIKCWELKEKRILPFRRDTQNEQIHVPVYKQKNPIKLLDETVMQNVVFDEPDDEKMDNQILKALQKRPVHTNKQTDNDKNSDILRDSGKQEQVPRRRRKQKQAQAHMDIFSLESMEGDSAVKQQPTLPMRRQQQQQRYQKS